MYAGSPNAAPAQPLPQSIARADLGVLGLLIAFGAAIRAHGFSSKDLWFDDAWVALAARTNIGQAIHMGLAAPGYMLLLREWITVAPGSTPWIQAPAFVLGVLAIPATWLLLRWYRMPRWIVVGGTLLVTVMPILVLYSTRVKEYPFDFLAACLLLGLYEGVRRAPSARRLTALGLVSSLAVFASGSCLVVVAPVWALVAAQLARFRSLRPAVLVWGTVTATSCVLVWALFLRELPRRLFTYWRVRGYLFDFHSTAALEKSVSLTFGGFVHQAFGIPAPPSFFRYSEGVHSASLTVAGILAVGLIVGIPIALAVRARSVTPAVASCSVLLLAVLLSVIGIVPFGDGRTDEVLYPAVFVCLATCAQAVSTRLALAHRGGHPMRAVVAASAVLLAAGALAFGALHPANYPTISLRGLASQLHRELRPGDRVFVSTFDSFGWCYYQLSPCAVTVGGTPQWVQGFRPVSRDRSVFIASSDQSVFPEIVPAMRARRIWYVGYTYGTYDVASSAGSQNEPVSTQMLRVLGRHGFIPVSGHPRVATRIVATHDFALLLERARSK